MLILNYELYIELFVKNSVFPFFAEVSVFGCNRVKHREFDTDTPTIGCQ